LTLTNTAGYCQSQPSPRPLNSGVGDAEASTRGAEEDPTRDGSRGPDLSLTGDLAAVGHPPAGHGARLRPRGSQRPRQRGPHRTEWSPRSSGTVR